MSEHCNEAAFALDRAARRKSIGVAKWRMSGACCCPEDEMQGPLAEHSGLLPVGAEKDQVWDHFYEPPLNRVSVQL